MGKLNLDSSIDELQRNDQERHNPADFRAEVEKGVDFETAVAATGYGKFHYILLLLCGFANGCYPCETINVSYLLPAAACDLNLSSQDKGWFSATTFVGMMVGSYMWGSFGDSLGRRKIIIISLIVDFLASLSSSFAPTFGLIMALKFLAGVGLSGVTVVFPYFAEFQPLSKRGGMISLLDGFYLEGTALMTCLAWLIIPQTFAYKTDSFSYNSWRLFISVCATLSLLSALSLLWLPESPKFLLAKGRHDEALQILRSVFHLNTGKPEEEYPYTKLLGEIDETSTERLTISKKLRHTLNMVREQSRMLFKPPLLLKIVVMIFIQLFLQTANAGLQLWLPELFHTFQTYTADHPNATVTICEITLLRNTTHVTNYCHPDQQVYLYGLIIAVIPFPGHVWTFFHMDKLGRKFFMVFGFMLAGVSAFLVLVVRSSAAVLVVTSFFIFACSMSFNAVNIITTELFPTTVRSTAFSITFVSARVGSIAGTVIFGALIEVICELPIGLFGAFMICGGFFAFLLPNTTGKSLE